MSQTTKVSKVQIRNRPEASGRVSTGSNMQVIVDGVQLKGVTFAKFEVKAGKIPKLLVEMFAEIEIDASLEVQTKQIEDTEFTDLKGKPFSVYQVGTPAALAIGVNEIDYFKKIPVVNKDGKLYFNEPGGLVEATPEQKIRHEAWVKKTFPNY